MYKCACSCVTAHVSRSEDSNQQELALILYRVGSGERTQVAGPAMPFHLISPPSGVYSEGPGVFSVIECLIVLHDDLHHSIKIRHAGAFLQVQH